MRFNEIYEGLLQGKKYRLNYWITDQYIYYDDSTSSFKSEDGDEYKLNASQIMVHDTWEEYIEPINYEKCIDCLCWLWNDKNVIHPLIGILSEIDEDTCYKFINQSGVSYKYCIPVKPEEIKFYKGE